MTKILLTGGHAGTTALATMEALKETHKEWELHWVGVEKAIEGSDAKTLEAKVFPGLDVITHHISTGRIQRKLTTQTIPSLLRIPKGFWQAIRLLQKIRPNAVVSFGGYAAFPVIVIAWFMGIPVIIHEQTAAAGMSNKLSSYFARTIALARPHSKKYFNSPKVVVVGNPIRKSILALPEKKKIGSPPVIFITGGSRGSVVLNSAVSSVLTDLLTQYEVIHQTGDIDFKKYLNIKSNLPANLRKKYQVAAFVEPQDMAEIYRKADIAIARAGANTVSELMFISRPSIFVPIPWARYNEQEENAQIAAKSGMAIIVHESELEGKSLMEYIDVVMGRWEIMASSGKSSYSKLDKNAASQLATHIEKLIK